MATALGGYAWERAGRIWYRVMSTKGVAPDAQFHTFALATVNAAISLYGDPSAEAQAVTSAWMDVGVLMSGQVPARAAVTT